MTALDHRITLDLNLAGFDGRDVDRIVPHFVSTRKTELILSWEPTVEGPESFRLVIEIAAGIGLGTLIKTFLEELSKDLYTWSKDRLTKLFDEKKQASGVILIELKDVTVSYHYSDAEEMTSFFQSIPELIDFVESHKGARWVASYSISEAKWKLDMED